MITKSLNPANFPVDDFADSTANWLRKSAGGTPTSVAVNSDISRSGSGKSLAMSFVAGDGIASGSTTFAQYANSAYRSELATYIEGGWDSLKFPDESWFAFSFYLPQSYTPVGNGYDEIICQLHTGKGTPAVYLSIRDGVLGLYRGSLKRAAYNPVTTVVTDNGTYQYREFGGWVPLCNVELEKWYDIAIHRKPSTYSGAPGSERLNNDGFANVYVNRVLLHSEQNTKTTPNFWDSEGQFIPQYFKFGVYVSAWNPTNWGGSVSLSRFNPGEERCHRMIYFDEIRIGDANSNLEEVSPMNPSGELSNPTFSHMQQHVIATELDGGLIRWGVPDGVLKANWPSDSGTDFVDCVTLSI